ncbi:MAG: PilZ domain-containing protein [Myxococcota bacterium]
MEFERRQSPRVPVHRLIRVGPPWGKPDEALSMADLSEGGVFLDADAPAQVGTRLSAEFALSDGLNVYVPEAEVTHTRRRKTGAGYGVRFLEISPESHALIQREVEDLCSDITGPSFVPPTDGPAPDPRGEPGAWDPLQGWSPEEDLMHDTVPERRLTLLPSFDRAAARAGGLTPAVSIGLGAVMLAVAGGLFVYMSSAVISGPVVEEIIPSEAPTSLSPSTHRVLMGQADPSVLDPEPRPTPSPDLDPLPLPTLTTPPAVEEPPAPEPAPASDADVVFDVPAQARVRAAYVLNEPDRFVVDVFGVTNQPEVMRKAPGTAVRFGRHGRFSRVVLDLDVPAKSGRAEIRDGRLEIHLTH